MLYDEFIDELRSRGVDIPTSPTSLWGIRNSSGPVIYGREKKLALVNSWHVGGASGRSCWGGELSSYSTGEPEPEWTSLISILELFWPEISYLQFRSLMTKVESDSEEDNDYYGNTSIYSVRILYLEALYEFLNAKGKL